MDTFKFFIHGGKMEEKIVYPDFLELEREEINYLVMKYLKEEQERNQ